MAGACAPHLAHAVSHRGKLARDPQGRNELLRALAIGVVEGVCRAGAKKVTDEPLHAAAHGLFVALEAPSELLVGVGEVLAHVAANSGNEDAHLAIAPHQGRHGNGDDDRDVVAVRVGGGREDEVVEKHDSGREAVLLEERPCEVFLPVGGETDNPLRGVVELCRDADHARGRFEDFCLGGLEGARVEEDHGPLQEELEKAK